MDVLINIMKSVLKSYPQLAFSEEEIEGLKMFEKEDENTKKVKVS